MDFEHDGFDADEELAESNDYYGEYPRSEFAWLYIAADIRDMGISKIGLTKKNARAKTSRG